MRCPKCMMEVHRAAAVCPYCHEDLEAAKVALWLSRSGGRIMGGVIIIGIIFIICVGIPMAIYQWFWGPSSKGGVVAFSPNGRHLACGGQNDGKLTIFDATSGEVVLNLGPGSREHNNSVASVAFSPDGKWLASTEAWNVRIWDASTGQEVRTLKGHTGPVTSVAFGPASKLLVSGSTKEIKVWESATGKELRNLDGGRVNTVAVSPDGKLLASGNYDGIVTVWDMDTCQEVHTLKGRLRDPDQVGWIINEVHSVVFSFNGKRLASGNADNVVNVWDVETGKEVLTLRGHTGRVTSVAFSPDGNLLASGSADNTVKVWNAQTGKEIRALRGHEYEILAVAISPDGTTLASSDWSALILWDATSGKRLRELPSN